MKRILIDKLNNFIKRCLEFFTFLWTLHAELWKVNYIAVGYKSILLIKINRKDILAILICSFFLIFFGYSLHSEIYKKKKRHNTERVGFLIAKRNTVQRKVISDTSWEHIEKKHPLYSLDRVRSGSNSIALLQLKDGTEIEMEENSLIIIDFTKPTGELDFVQGSVRAKGSTKNVFIKSKGKSINIKDGELLLTATEKAKNAAVFVNQGEMQIIDQAGQIQIIKEKQQVILENKKTVIQSIAIQLQQPKGGERIVSEKKTKTVHFQWESSDSNVNTFLFELSLDIGFSKVIARQKIKKNYVSLQVQTGPNYYWRVSSLKKDKLGKKRFSNISKFSLLKSEKPHLEYPYNKQIFTNRETSDLPISFGWREDGAAKSYILKIARGKLSNTIRKERLTTNFINLKLPQGIYYWQVIKTNHFAKGTQTSDIYKFSIIQNKDKAIASPQLLYPRKNEPLYSEITNTAGIRFSWYSPRNVKKTQIEIASDKNFTKSIFSKTLAVNYFHFNKSLAIGTYFWRVKGIDAKTSFSTSYFKVVNTVTNPLSFSILNPKQNALFDSKKVKRDGIIFKWKQAPIKGTSEIFISQDRNFKAIHQQKEVKGTNIRIRNIKNGSYFWIVHVRNPASKKILARSNIGNFEISNFEKIEMQDGTEIIGIIIRQGRTSLTIRDAKKGNLRKILLRDIKLISFPK